YHTLPSWGRLLQIAVPGAALFIIVSWWLHRTLLTTRYPKNLPRLGQKEGVSWKDMRQRYMDDSLSMFNHIYENYSKKGITVLIPVFGSCDEVILPNSSLQWLARQPDNVASSMQAQIDNICLDYTLGHEYAHDPWGGELVKTGLNPTLDAICAVMNPEAVAGVDDVLGQPDDWKEIPLFPTCRALLGRVTLAFTLGDSPEGHKLCRDPDFIAVCYAVLDAMLGAAGELAGVRPALRPLYGVWAARPVKAKLADMRRRFAPLYRERLALVDGQAAGEKKATEEPRDLLQMLMRHAAAHRPCELRSLDAMTRRLAVSNFGSMHQSVLTLHNLILDVVGSDAGHGTVSALRGEAAALVRADSCARETQRVHSFLGRAVQRRVVAPSGLVTEDGVRLPRGAMVSVLTHQAQTDGELLPAETCDDSSSNSSSSGPEVYDPFRFARPRLAAAADADAGAQRPAALGHLSFAATGPDYLPFSHGRHACPGRFFVDVELKMVLAALLMKYDVEFPEDYGGKRPPNVWFAGFGIPPWRRRCGCAGGVQRRRAWCRLGGCKALSWYRVL
ncbi:uncharacterized protein PG998_008661, partial [Apiospora kogelbergensis]|uniref:uncharacterized protein n=1 Tax=Apiospora kogelbergensis TaxID=1337665 RepID=UPI00312EA509